MISKDKKIIFFVLFVVVILLILFAKPLENTKQEVPVISESPSKIIYTTDLSVDEEMLRSDCRERGGLFETCGSACPSDAESCVSVCAFVCNLE